MARTVAAIAAALLLLWTAWRVHALSEEVGRLEPACAAPVPEERSAASVAVPEAPRLAQPSPEPARDDARVAVLEETVGALERRLGEVERQSARMREVLADVMGERILQNEAAAISVARLVVLPAMAQFQTSAKVDVDRDRTGEYGGFLEMSGVAAGRMASPLNPPVVSSAFRTLSNAGEATRNGYLFRIYLPDARGWGVGESETGFDAARVDPNLSETTWCLYAWPVEYGRTGTRTFFVNQAGDVLQTECPVYSGSGSGGPTPDAAFSHVGSIAGPHALGRMGQDGKEWKYATP